MFHPKELSYTCFLIQQRSSEGKYAVNTSSEIFNSELDAKRYNQSFKKHKTTKINIEFLMSRKLFLVARQLITRITILNYLLQQ